MRQGPTVGWSAGAGRPTVIQPSEYRGGAGRGVHCCCCTCCTCINLGFVRTKPGGLKVVELVCSAITLSLSLEWGLPFSATMGQSFTTFLVTTGACLLVVSLLVFCYVISANSFNLIRSSVLETVFNTVACVLYLSSSCYLSVAVQTWLWSGYLTTPRYAVYPAMTFACILGLVLGVVHGVDAWRSYRHLTGKPGY